MFETDDYEYYDTGAQTNRKCVAYPLCRANVMRDERIYYLQLIKIESIPSIFIFECEKKQGVPCDCFPFSRRHSLTIYISHADILQLELPIW